MNALHFTFMTAAFHDGAEARTERVNESVGGQALAVGLSGRLKDVDHTASTPWVEDHGCAFDIRDGQRLYLCTGSIEDDDATQREAHVLLTLSRSLWDRVSGRNILAAQDAVAGAIGAVLASNGDVAELSRE